MICKTFCRISLFLKQICWSNKMLFTCYEQTLASSHIHLKQYYIVHIDASLKKKKSLKVQNSIYWESNSAAHWSRIRSEISSLCCSKSSRLFNNSWSSWLPSPHTSAQQFFPGHCGLCDTSVCAWLGSTLPSSSIRYAWSSSSCRPRTDTVG